MVRATYGLIRSNQTRLADGINVSVILIRNGPEERVMRDDIAFSAYSSLCEVLQEFGLFHFQGSRARIEEITSSQDWTTKDKQKQETAFQRYLYLVANEEKLDHELLEVERKLSKLVRV